jgi:transcriptional regulator with XRE-family HTH domain
MSNLAQAPMLDNRLVALLRARGYFGSAMVERFQDRVRAAMQAQGISKAALARTSGVPYHALDKFLKRDGATTSTENAVALAKALGIPVDGEAEYSELERLFHQLEPEQRQFLLSAARGLLTHS